MRLPPHLEYAARGGDHAGTEPPPPPDEATAANAAESARLRAELRASGPTNARWAREAPLVFELPPSGEGGVPEGIRVGPVECHRGGCVTTVSYPDIGAYHALNSILPRSEAFLSWQGVKKRTGPVRNESGEVLATWVLFAPELDQPVGN